METKAFKFNVKNLDTAGDSDNFVFEGHLAVFNNVDHGDDKILPGAFKGFLEESSESNRVNIPVLWSHDRSEPIGVFPVNRMKEDEKGLYVEGILPKSDSFVQSRVIPQLKIGSVGGMSIGYSVKDFSFDKGVRLLKDLNLYEGSLVSMPMNSDATITSMKVMSFDDLDKFDKEKLIELLSSEAVFSHDDAEKLVKKVFDNIDKKSKMTAFENRLDDILNNIKGRA